MIFLSAILHMAFSIEKYNILIKQYNVQCTYVCDEFFISKSYAIFALSAGIFAISKLSATNFPHFLRINKSYFYNYNPRIL